MKSLLQVIQSLQVLQLMQLLQISSLAETMLLKGGMRWVISGVRSDICGITGL
jgi:hypothetical protein